jgi:hypothetical protein
MEIYTAYLTPLSSPSSQKYAALILNINLNLLLAAFVLALSFPAWSDFTGNVVGVADNDTITVLDVDKLQHEISYRLKQFLMANQS